MKSSKHRNRDAVEGLRVVSGGKHISPLNLKGNTADALKRYCLLNGVDQEELVDELIRQFLRN